MNIEKRNHLIHAGERLFSEYGYKKVNIEDVVDAAGISTGGFYKFFKSKEDFYMSIIFDLERRGIQEADKIVKSYHSSLYQLKAIYRFTTLGVKQSRILRGILLRDKKYIYPGLEQLLDRKEGLKAHIESIIETIIKNGAVQRVFRTGIFSNPKQMLLAQFNVILYNLDNANIQELLDDTLKLIERGLKRRIRLPKRPERLDRQKDRLI